MVVRADERLEEQPRPAGEEAESLDVAIGELLGGGFRGGQADPAGDGRRQQPQNDEGCGDPRGVRIDGEDKQCTGAGNHDSTSHLPVETAQGEIVFGLDLRGGFPLEQVSPSDVHPRQRPHDRVHHQPRLVGEERDAEDDVSRGDNDVAANGAQMAAHGDPGAARHHPRCHRQCRRHDERRNDERRPPPGRRPGQRPGGNQSADGERGGHRSSQVVDHLPSGDAADAATTAGLGAVARSAQDPRQ